MVVGCWLPFVMHGGGHLWVAVSAGAGAFTWVCNCHTWVFVVGHWGPLSLRAVMGCSLVVGVGTLHCL